MRVIYVKDINADMLSIIKGYNIFLPRARFLRGANRTNHSLRSAPQYCMAIRALFVKKRFPFHNLDVS